MIFHVSCPLTCQKICFCDLGFNNGLKSKKARENFSIEVDALEAFLKNTWTVRIGEETGIVQVPVPRVVQRQAVEDDVVAALQRQAVEAKAAKEDYIRRLETGDGDLSLRNARERPHTLLTSPELAIVREPRARIPHFLIGLELLEEAHSPCGKEELGSSNVKVMCRICFSGENEGSTKALKMLSCKTCDKKYHRSCIKSWAENRDLFHWSSWDCPSCRTCEVCKSAGDPSKLMFCRRCDDAYHCYCQTPPHKNVGHGTYVCAKHTRCHSCGSTVPGNGPSTRWFLGYTCCDACGRLFVKGNYCPVCLKVYRDSEMTPMVCCDICERWIHCSCDGISDEKYQQFQSDQNLQYTCGACRGDCYQVRDTDDAVRELWRRKDEYDRKLIATLRANAGLPSQGDISSYFDDDHQNYSIRSKHDYGRPLKFSVKGSGDVYTSTKELGNPVSKNALHAIKENINSFSAEGAHQNHEKHANVRENQQLNYDLNPRTKFQDEGKKKQDLHIKEPTAKDAKKSENVKGTKLVIHIGSKTKNASSSPKSETSSYHKEQDVVVNHGNEDVNHLKMTDTNNHMDQTGRNGKGTKVDYTSTRRSSKHGYKEDTGTPVIISSKQRKNNSTYAISPVNHENDDDIMLTKKKHAGSSAVNLQTDTVPYTSRLKFVSSASPSVATNDPKPLLKLKFKNPYFEQKSSWAPKGEEESIVKGQRSKRKRPTIIVKNSSDKSEGKGDSATMHQPQNLLTDQEMEANWILQKLGKDAIGKRVEVHQLPDGSWRKGTVTDVTIEEGNASSSSLFVIYDDGKTTTLDLKKQAVRFASQKHYKRTKSRH